ncbi:hypothetical protein CHITON_1064 [Thermococcus chitonophagus]|uniref:Uncharacterized protein n=1 Tax=Thermococcus chitonophagus TaxID=54262 RepID=A0A160VS15_9EURY|nr:hypothetical protein CHITON_1064 [Thermococcus chitonophagus]
MGLSVLLNTLVSIVLGVLLAMYKLLYAYPGPEWVIGFVL